jgi:hypothetical protein
MLSLSNYFRVTAVAVCLTVSGSLLTPALMAQEAPRRELTERVSTGLARLSELMEARNYDGALALINPLLNGAAPNSYDQALLSQIKAQLHLMKSEYAASIPPLETAYRLGRQFNFFEGRQLLELAYYLAQLYYQEANAPANAGRQIELFDRAYRYISVYMEDSAEPSADARLFAASILYNQATLEANNVDQGLLNRAMEQAQLGLRSSLDPRDSFYVLILAALQQNSQNVEAAELLEFLVSKYPTNRQYWQQLAATYMNLAALAESNPRESRRWSIRTILTIERAQALGIMTEPRDHFNLVGIYFNIERFEDAVRLLEQGLNSGTIESTQRNWELLASSYQQIRQEFRAIDTLKRAAELFPEAGALEFQIANIFYSIDNFREAYRHGQKALEKGNVSNIGQTRMFVAYLAYELQEYDTALEVAVAAAEVSGEADSTAARLVTAIREAMAQRAATIESQTL